MKKNRMMRLASILLVCVLLTTSVISGTFAKYVTKVEGTDSARVARWGFTGEDADIAITDLFKKAYDQHVQGYADVIAPGTTNSAKFIFEYSEGATDVVAKPEVDYTFEVSTDGSKCAQSIKDNANIKWAVVKTSDLWSGDVVPNNEWGTWDEMIAEIEKLDGDKSYSAQQLPDMSNVEYTIAWMWDFETSDAQNEIDTDMGNADDLAEVTIKITITATQID